MEHWYHCFSHILNIFVGVILFELVSGVPPFFAESPEEVFANISDYKNVLKELESSIEEEGDIKMSSVLWSFIKRYLNYGWIEHFEVTV